MIYWRTVTLMMLPVTTFAFFHAKQVDSSVIYHCSNRCATTWNLFFKLINPPFPWPHYMEEMFVCISLYKRFTWTWWLQCWEKNRLILKGINHIWFFSQRKKFISLCYAVITCFIFSLAKSMCLICSTTCITQVNHHSS